MKLLSLLLCATLCAACSSPANRPITEEIPLDEMNSLLRDSPKYEVIVLLAERFRGSASTPDLARANDLTYEQLYKFFLSYSDTELHNRLTTDAEQQWETRFGSAYAQVDSILGHWNRYLTDNKPDSYVNVELRRIDPAESTYGSAQVEIWVTPLKGALDKVEGSFGLFLRDRAHSFGDFSIARHNTFSFEQGLRTATSCNTGMTYSIWDITDGDIPYNMYPDRAGLPMKELLEKYWFDYAITTLVKDGKAIRLVDVLNNIPDCVSSYWSETDKESVPDDEYLRGRIVRELVDPEFCNRTEYVHDYKEQFFRDKDPLAAWFMLDR